MKKIIALILISITLFLVLGFKSVNTTEAIVIYTSTEDYNMKLLEERLEKNFPNYKIEIEYLSTSNIATKVIEEGEKTECDIVFALE